ncbi:MAG: ABC transporter ATP-binding protein [Epsilonproteobacteria bacterium]|nr:ABC transporter ATP-binding protein [Campylobacterota bacterium]
MVEIAIKKPLQGSQGTMILDVNVHIEEGSFTVIMGESGSGKTTLLRVLAGLEKAEGDIRVEGKAWKNLPPQQREIGFAFQDYALFENMSVEQNLLFVHEDKALAEKLLSLTELTGLATRNVKSLSGGQKQRVSLCRAMMKKPKLLLMDEPLSALDEKMRIKLQDEIAKLHRAFGTTTLMVSHDAEASYALADRIVVLEQGKVIKDGSKEEVLVENVVKRYTLLPA